MSKKGKKLLNILLLSSEMTPFAKTGGLADVTAALAQRMADKGHTVKVIIPKYNQIQSMPPVKHEKTMCVQMGSHFEEWCRVEETEPTKGTYSVIFIEHQNFFGRNGLYHDEWMNDYVDNACRFGFLCRAGLQYCIDQNWSPDIVHSNDWQTALTSAYIKLWFWNNPILANAASVLTIHNIAYQGVYPEGDTEYLGLDNRAYNEHQFESFHRLNLLKGGIFYADVVNTVSEGHAREITSPYGGFGLAPYISNKGYYFKGITNGVDYTIWSPQKDPLIPATYSPSDLTGKKTCKKKLQEEFKLAEDDHICLIGCIGRFVEQKGYHLIRDVIERALEEMHIQFVMLGSGDNDLESFFGSLPARYPGKAGSFIGYNNDYAHLIEAGADFFLMPSLFEPCGLNQLYSLKYGTLPIVRATGGLEDTVEQYDEESGTGTGFKFWDAHPAALYYTIGWAISTYYDRPAHMKKLIKNAMSKDFSWDRSVEAYENLYILAREAKKEYDKHHAL